jgi:phosphatidylglycerol:prolipoprotein diacylglycerol transferase
MLPELFRLPFINLPIHSYGVLIVAGFLTAVYIAYRRCLRYGKYENDFLDFAFWALVGGLIGSRLVFIMVEWKTYFVDNPWTQIGSTGIKIPAVFAMWQGGLVYWGAFLGGFIAFLFFASKRKLPKLIFADLVVVGVPLAQMFGRLGCVAAGCCWGQPAYHVDAAGKAIADIPIAMRFPPGSSAYDTLFGMAPQSVRDLMLQSGTTVPLFPSQLLEAAGACLIFWILMWMSPRKWFHGQLLLGYAVLYSVMRSILELFRGDFDRGYVIDGVLSTSQFISVSVIAIALVTSLVMWKKNKVSPTA